MLHFFTAVFFAVLVVLLAWPGHVIATLCVFAVAFLFMACLVELLRHHVQVLVRQLDAPQSAARVGKLVDALSDKPHGLFSGDM